MNRFLLALTLTSAALATGAALGEDEKPFNRGKCTWRGIPLYGKVQIVESFPDVNVQIVKSFADLRVQNVESFPDQCGKWQFVDNFADIKIKYVDSFPDVKITMVESFPGMR